MVEIIQFPKKKKRKKLLSQYTATGRLLRSLLLAVPAVALLLAVALFVR